MRMESTVIAVPGLRDFCHVAGEHVLLAAPQTAYSWSGGDLEPLLTTSGYDEVYGVTGSRDGVPYILVSSPHRGARIVGPEGQIKWYPKIKPLRLLGGKVAGGLLVLGQGAEFVPLGDGFCSRSFRSDVPGRPVTAAMATDGSVAALSGVETGAVLLVDPRSGADLGRVEIPSRIASHLAFTPDGGHVYVGHRKKRFSILRDRETGEDETLGGAVGPRRPGTEIAFFDTFTGLRSGDSMLVVPNDGGPTSRVEAKGLGRATGWGWDPAARTMLVISSVSAKLGLLRFVD